MVEMVQGLRGFSQSIEKFRHEALAADDASAADLQALQAATACVASPSIADAGPGPARCRAGRLTCRRVPRSRSSRPGCAAATRASSTAAARLAAGRRPARPGADEHRAGRGHRLPAATPARPRPPRSPSRPRRWARRPRSCAWAAAPSAPRPAWSATPAAGTPGMGEPPVEPSAPAPPAPGSPPSDKDLQKQATYRSDLATYQDQSQAREAPVQGHHRRHDRAVPAVHGGHEEDPRRAGPGSQDHDHHLGWRRARPPVRRRAGPRRPRRTTSRARPAAPPPTPRAPPAPHRRTRRARDPAAPPRRAPPCLPTTRAGTRRARGRRPARARASRAARPCPA